MAYRKGYTDLPDLPRKCPVCHGGRKDAEAVKVHNVRVAQTGERSYIGRVGVSRIGND